MDLKDRGHRGGSSGGQLAMDIAPPANFGFPSRMHRHHCLDLVRGLAALAVVVYHWLLFDRGVDVLSLGTFSVYLFFVLSATTMAMVYGDKLDLRAFYRNRFARIAPLLALVALASAVLWGYWGRAALTGSGLFALTPAGFVSTATGAWSLAIELLFYALFPTIVLLRPSPKALALACVVLIAAQMLYLDAIRQLEPHWHYYSVPMTFAPYFAMGLLAHALGGERSHWFLIPTLVGMAVIGSYSLFFPSDLYREGVPHLALMILAGFVVFSAYRTNLPAFLVATASFLGEISYALYLTHPFVRNYTQGAGLLLTLALSVVVAFIVNRLFERPARNWLRPTAPNRAGPASVSP